MFIIYWQIMLKQITLKDTDNLEDFCCNYHDTYSCVVRQRLTYFSWGFRLGRTLVSMLRVNNSIDTSGTVFCIQSRRFRHHSWSWQSCQDVGCTDFVVVYQTTTSPCSIGRFYSFDQWMNHFFQSFFCFPPQEVHCKVKANCVKNTRHKINR